MHRRIQALLFLFTSLVVSGALAARAADLHNVLVDYSITSWGVKDGLPAGAIWSLAQDADGYLWLGADFGLVRFDGVRFVSWEALGHAPLSQPSVRIVHVSKDGSLWVGFGGRGGVSRIRGEQVRNYGERDGLPAGQVTMLVEDHVGTVWTGNGKGLYRYSDDRWEQWTAADGVSANPVHTGFVSRAGDFFVATDTDVFRRRSGEDVFQRVEKLTEVVQSIVEDSFGQPWVTDRIVGVRRLGERRSIDSPSENGKGYRLLSDRRGNLWVATFGQGLWRVRVDGAHKPTIDRATDLTGLSSNTTYSVFEDRDGNIWAGTTDGLNRLSQHKLTQITNLGLVTGLEATPDGSVWAGTASGLIQLSQSSGEWQERKQVRGFRPAAMYADEHGTLWVATNTSLLRFVSGSASPSVVTNQVRQIKSITSDSRGGVWLYDLDRGLQRWTENGLQAVNLPSGLQNARVGAAYTDRSGRLWLGFGQGQVAVTDGDNRFRVYGPNDGLDLGACRTIYEDREGVVWFGGSRGLGRFADGHFVTLTQANGVPSESVTGIVDDGADGLWFGTALGIVRIKRTAFPKAIDHLWDQFHYSLYDASDGVAGTTGWIGQRSAVRSRDGRLWFLTARGVTIIDPRTLQTGTPPAPVRIDGVLVNDRRLRPLTMMALTPGVTRLEIDYTVLNLVAPRRTRFRYRLEGFDSDWVDAGIARQAIYTNLAPRQYRFRVEANNEVGSWAGPEAVWDFSVRPAFYQTAWFLVVCAAAVAVGAWSAWALRLRQVRNQFSMMLGERVRLSREIHDTLLQNLVGLALQLDVLSDARGGLGNKERELVRMRKQVEEYIREARQSIWNLRSSLFTRRDLETGLRHSGERAVENGIGFTLLVKGTRRKCSEQVEEQLLRVGHEAILNAIRHSQAHEIRVDVEYDDSLITLRVTDDGRGFDPTLASDETSGHWGVLTMKERAETVGGAFRIVSSRGNGTEVELAVPASI